MKICLLIFLIPVCFSDIPSCCMTRQSTFDTFTVSSIIDSKNGRLHTSESNGTTYVDYDRKVELNIETTTENGKIHHITRFSDYNSRKIYEVKDDHCVIKDALLINGSMPSNCFPGPNAGNSYIRREKLGDTVTDVWRADLMQSHGFIVVMHVTANCTPITETDYGVMQGVPTQSTTYISNVIPRIVDQGVVSVPICFSDVPSCCMTRQSTFDTFTVSSIIDSKNGRLHTSETTGKTYMDFDRKARLSINTKTENGKVHQITSFTDFNMGKTYEVKDGHCIIKDALLINGSMPSNCFPGPNAGNSYIRREMLGDTVTDVWRTDLMQSHGFMAVMHVTANCTPITETDYGVVQGVPTHSTTFISNVIPRIVDQSVLSVPSLCLMD